ncbi:MAG: NAD-dependent epimerase/dehydratase family protein [Hamadaea sp.]|uniref:NAD-dependent epimerase/dehydratase family protein n=1 Tax=Hamadaea sp. TaxID=2024425 RepID=UPI001801AB55|nr:NAD-dependent epimerase/dehydratase family protein [Hamadaea sp.]NUR69655.1 NAD-dependent epimerase/dehydratase family protein [Hamadaea sp.]NUT19522.1 NAD-dependent epimerase/dehydratase family protein [Hamadaea sp.]
MKVLVIGATGYIGSAAARKLRERGHEVVALAREAAAGSAYEVRIGDLTKPATVAAAIGDDIEAVVNLATLSGDQAVDQAATAALVDALAGRVLVQTSGIWVLGRTGREAVDESAPTDALPIVSYRPLIEQQVLAAAERGVRSVVIRPGIVYGNGGGIPAMLLDLARKHGVGRYFGGVETRWPMVHVDDLAELYALAVESAPAGTLLHGVDEPAVSLVAMAAATDLAAGGTGRAEPWLNPEATAAFGDPFAEALALDQAVSGQRARDLLGWQPADRNAVRDLHR